MSDLKSLFDQAAAAAQSLPEKPGNDTLLKMYALYKQATTGDVTGSRPGMMDFVGRAKFDAWTKLKGTGQEVAMEEYVNLVKSLQG